MTVMMGLVRWTLWAIHNDHTECNRLILSKYDAWLFGQPPGLQRTDITIAERRSVPLISFEMYFGDATSYVSLLLSVIK